VGPIGFNPPEQPSAAPPTRFTRVGQAKFIAEEALPTVILKIIQRLPQYRLIRIANSVGRIAIAENLTEYFVFKLLLSAVPPAQYVTNVVKEQIGLKVKDPVDTSLAVDFVGPVKFIESIGQAVNDIARETVQDIGDVEQFLRDSFLIQNGGADGGRMSGREILNELAARAISNVDFLEHDVLGFDRLTRPTFIPDALAEASRQLSVAQQEEQIAAMEAVMVSNYRDSLRILASTRNKETGINESWPLYTSDP
jgi:hypothetical protein